MTGPAVPTTASLRILINKILLSDSDLDAFCLDFFREDVHKKFTSGLDRTQKENILLGCVEVHIILNALKQHSPQKVETNARILEYASGDESSARDTRDVVHSGSSKRLIVPIALVASALALAIGLIVLKHDGTKPDMGPMPKLSTPISMSTLSDAERDQVARIKKDEYVPVDVQSFYKIAVLSGQITESEFKYFTENAIEILSASEKLYEAGLSENSQVRINIKGGGGVFIYRTVSEAVFNRAQKEVLKIFKNIKGSYSGNPITDDLYGIKITIRGTSRFFDISGIPGLNDRAWIGFDLRRPDQH